MTNWDDFGIDESMPVRKKGRGWHGDPEGHAKAGRKGGRARQRKARESKRQSRRKTM